MSSRDQDAELKLRAAKFFWSMGYICSMEVSISAKELRYGELKRFDLTDLDVVGIKFEPDLTWRTVVADCKSVKTAPSARLFWLRGVMDFFGAQRGYLVQPEIGAETRELATKLSISLLDDDNLQKYETDKRIGGLQLCGFEIPAYDKYRAVWRSGPAKGERSTAAEKQLQRLYNFLSYGYWFNDEYRNVQQLLTEFSDAAKAISGIANKDRAKALVYTGATLLGISLLKLCGAVQATKSADIHREVQRYIFGGAALAAERRRLMELIKKVTKAEFSLEPPYYQDLLELANRLVTFSQFARDVPRYTDLVLRENLLGGRSDSLEVILGASFDLHTLKMAKDVGEFLIKATGIEAELLSDLLKQ